MLNRKTSMTSLDIGSQECRPVLVQFRDRARSGDRVGGDSKGVSMVECESRDRVDRLLIRFHSNYDAVRVSISVMGH